MVNTCTCLTAGVLVFSILGHMAHLQGATVEDVARSGPGLVFLTYPELVLSLPGSFIWAILFFAMLLVITNYYVVLDIFFRQITTFVKVCVAFVFGLHTPP